MNPETTLTDLRSAVAAAATPAERANALNQLAGELERQGEYAESLAAAEEAHAAAKEAGDAAAEAEALRVQGSVHWRRGNYPTALPLLEQSLKLYEEREDRSDVARVTVGIGNVYASLSDYPKALEYYSRALALFEELGKRSGVAGVTGNIGNVYLNLSDYPKVLEYYSRALAMHEELGNRSGVASVTSNIGTVYGDLSDYPKALEYLSRALAMHEELGERSGVAMATNNIGIVYKSLSDYPKALEYYSRALAMHEELGNRSGVAITTGNIGIVYQNLSDYPKALEYFSRALAMREELGERSGVASITRNIGSLYAQKDFAEYNPAKAEELLQQAIALNEELGTKDQLYSAHKSLANLYEQESRFEEALTHFKKFHEVKEEVQSEEAKKKAIQVEQQRQIAEMEKRTAAERADAEATKRVLHNILPPTIAQRVVRGEEHIAESFESVTVLFADIVGFTVLSQGITPRELVAGLDVLFSQFDELAEKYGLEKIKTIGDAYMAVSGLPESRENHAESAARMAIELVEVIAGFDGLGDGIQLQVRIGLHSGEVVAGIIGKKKFAYDLWGDAVNTASRMESHGEAGKIHVSEEFAAALSSAISKGELPIMLEERGELTIKGKGTLRTYFLNPSTK
ncbi:MAG: tetratricopeptide repeat protein [Chlorobi bacterium]|nr:tetratricopeptide repeat protein [Chlorobiota bacterium]MBX7215749.1 tetratricopeptide repeat protein [Candidatus Kapabacteria bacterium]